MSKKRQGKGIKRERQGLWRHLRQAAEHSIDDVKTLSSTERRRRIRALARASAAVLLAALVGGLISVWWGPWQQRRIDDSMERRQQQESTHSPLAEVVESGYDFDNDVHNWVFAGPLPSEAKARMVQIGDHGSTGWLDTLDKSLQDLGAVRISGDTYRANTVSKVKFVIRGRQDEPVLVTKMKARVVKRLAPLSGTRITEPPAGETPVVQIAFDLDAGDASARVFSDQNPDELGPRYSDVKQLSLNQGEPVTVTASASTTRCYCEWVIDITLADSSGTRVETVTVNNHGEPFKSSAMVQHYRQEYEWRYNTNTPHFVVLPSGEPLR